MRYLVAASIVLAACASTPKTDYDIVLRHATLYDGSGKPAMQGDLAIRGDRIAAIGNVPGHGANEIDVHGLAVAPGFINIMSQAQESLIADGRGLSDTKQGVTTEVFGEGESMGPLTPPMKKEFIDGQGDIKYPIEWTTLREYLDWLQRRGVTPNIGSFLGAATPRVAVLGRENRDPSPAEMQQMVRITREAMAGGAFGVASALIYAPGAYAKTPELIELAKVAGEHGGIYISHMRSEGNRLVEAVDELITIAREAHVPAEIYHLKAAGQSNWPKMDEVIRHVDVARASGLKVSADMYTYTAGMTGLDAAMPTWVQAGGYEAWRKRLQDPATRQRVIAEMRTRSDTWENLMMLAGGADRVLLVGFKSDALKPLTGKTLAEVAKMRGVSPEDAAIDLVIEDGTRVSTIYFLMSEDNLRKQIALPHVSFGSDADSSAPEGVFLKSSNHPRAYGNFANLLGKFVRGEHVISLEEGIRRMTSLPAQTLGIANRGVLTTGNFADVVVFDPQTIGAQSTYEKPMQFATGVVHVFVNGVQVLKDGQHTGAKPGRVVVRERESR
ncbi:MAG: N-acyl-D-amino-acid deacylase [Thermoanaerobaculia bacterium]|jgi:N-acyl-D-amino-acid deacylase|nr:N-acyl-D-amino-acid deacylase [Thermoanaerobaculia bacterium]